MSRKSRSVKFCCLALHRPYYKHVGFGVHSTTRAEPPWSTWGLRELCRWAEKPSHLQKGLPIHGVGRGSGVQSCTGTLLLAVPKGGLTEGQELHSCFQPSGCRLTVLDFCSRPSCTTSVSGRGSRSPRVGAGREAGVCPGSFAWSQAWHRGGTRQMPHFCSHGQSFRQPRPLERPPGLFASLRPPTWAEIRQGAAEKLWGATRHAVGLRRAHSRWPPALQGTTITGLSS